MAMFGHERSLVTRYQGRPFVLLGVNLDNDLATLKRVQNRDHLTWRSWFDGPGAGPIAGEWKVDGLPTIYLIDAKGMVRNQYEGEPDLNELDGAIAALVKEAEK